MIKLGLIQTKSYDTNDSGIRKLSKLLIKLGKKEADIVCLPEQWLKHNSIKDFESEFFSFTKIAKEYSMIIIPGAFYERRGSKWAITAPVIGTDGKLLGKQDKVHPFGYENRLLQAAKTTKLFRAKCKFGILICYDMVFPQVANSLVSKGADVLFSPSRIVRRGIKPWHLYVQVRALENRVPIVAANMENYRFGDVGWLLSANFRDIRRIIVPSLAERSPASRAGYGVQSWGKNKGEAR